MQRVVDETNIMPVIAFLMYIRKVIADAVVLKIVTAGPELDQSCISVLFLDCSSRSNMCSAGFDWGILAIGVFYRDMVSDEHNTPPRIPWKNHLSDVVIHVGFKCCASMARIADELRF